MGNVPAWEAPVLALAAKQQGFVSFAQLAPLKVTRPQREAQVAARRWLPLHRRGIVVMHLEESIRDSAWLALARVGPHARLGGVTALQVAGLTGYVEPRRHVWVPKSFQKGVSENVVLHETRRWAETDCVTEGIPRSTPEVAVVQGALWARSLRQAALVLTMSLQQQVAAPDGVGAELEKVRRHVFRRPLQAILADVRGGTESLNELDFARGCRLRGLPEPNRQVLRKHANGRYVLDAHFDGYRVVVEVQGAGHLVLDKVLTDEVRLLDLAVDGDTMVPVSTTTLRIAPEDFYQALARLLRSRGWTGTYHPAA